MPVGVSSENAWLSLDFEKIGLGQLPQHLTTVKIYTPGGHDMKFFFSSQKCTWCVKEHPGSC